MDQNKAQIQNIEELAKLGYWEWRPLSAQASFSAGFLNLFSFIGADVSPTSLINYLKTHCHYQEHVELITYLQNVKKGIFPGILTFAIPMRDLRIKYFELNAAVSKHSGQEFIAGTVQEITERAKYDILKEKELVFEKKIAEIAARFISDYDYKSAILLTLNELADICKAEQVELLKIENDYITENFAWRDPFVNTYQFIQPGIPAAEKKYLIDLIKHKKLIYFQNIADFPDRLPFLKNSLMAGGIKSLLITSIQKDKQTVGALVIMRNRPLLKWDFSDIHMLKMTSLIISHALKQNHMHASLKKSEKRLQFALLAGNLGTYEYNLVDKSRSFDERYASMFGYSHSTLNRMDNWFIKNIHPEHLVAYKRSIDDCLEGNQNYFELEYQICCKNGQYKWVNDWGIVTEVNTEAEPLKIVGVIQDISRRKNAEEALIFAKDKAEENEKLKTAFLANMSHEIRTPMNGILGFAELLYHNMVNDNDKHNYLEIIYKNSNRLLTLINNIIDISKIETGQLDIFETECNLAQLITDLERLLHKTIIYNTNIEFSITHDLDLTKYSLKTDESRLKQILQNLIENAFKFTDEGFVEVTIVINSSGNLQFGIKDSGMGIPKEFSNQLFNRFSQSEYTVKQNFGGTGLGLPISKGLIEALGGCIWVKSLRGVGSTFYFTLPLQKEKISL